jgi:hypothetical protein
MAFRAAQLNFSKGELGDELLARFDVAAYAAGAKRLRNVVILKYGGVTKRPGTRLVAEVHDISHPTRLIPFQFSFEQAYALELGQGYMRPAALGGMVTGEELSIAGISNAETAEVSVPFHGFAVGDEIFFHGIEGMEELNGRIQSVVGIIDASRFTIDADSRGWSAFTGAAGGTTRTGAPVPPPTPPPVPDPVPLPPPPIVVGGGVGNGGVPGGSVRGGPYRIPDRIAD